MLTFQEARALLKAHQQEQILKWFDHWTDEEKTQLFSQIEALDFKWLRETFLKRPLAIDSGDISAYREVIAKTDVEGEKARIAGESALRAGRVGCLLVAGGQGTRLGFDGPKGAFKIGAVSGRTLFQVHVERLLALGRRFGVVPPLYLMTSPANHLQTCDFFAAHKNFGMPAERLIIFPQGVVPAVDESGKLLLEAKGRLVMTPNGNGGLFKAMLDHGVFSHMDDQGVDIISYIQVDNPLAQSCDARFVGYHLLRESQFSCKAIEKRNPEEKVGSYALVKGRLQIVEYGELSDKLARQTSSSGELLFGYSNPGLFLWSKAFALSQARRRDLPFHKAHKKIPCLDHQGQPIQPKTPNGYKFESFAMDTLKDADRSIVLWCDREEEFAPVKNAAGEDSPKTARRMMTRIYAKWLRAAGGEIVAPDVQVEISPLFALDAQELGSRIPGGFKVKGDLYLSEENHAI